MRRSPSPPPPRPPPSRKGYLRVDGTLTKFSERKFDVVCTLRPIPEKQPTRTRVLEWVAEAVEKFGVPAERARVGEVNHAQRRGISDEFLEAQFSSKIIVTCNPSHWEGDFRLWEAVASGALVFVDNMWVPTAHPFVDGEHLILYDQHDKDAFLRKLGYYLAHPDEARAIARRASRTRSSTTARSRAWTSCCAPRTRSACATRTAPPRAHRPPTPSPSCTRRPRARSRATRASSCTRPRSSPWRRSGGARRRARPKADGERDGR